MKNFLQLSPTVALIMSIIACCWPQPANAAVARRGDVFTLSGDTYTVTLSARNGSILAVRQMGHAASIMQSGEWGLWQARLQDGTKLNATDYSATNGTHAFQGEADPKTNALRLNFMSATLDVRVTVTGRATGVDFQAQAQPKQGAVLDFSLPARLRFDPDQLTRFVCPANGNFSVGTAFKSAFFKLQPQDNSASWSPQLIGGAGYAALYGGPLDQRANEDPPTTLTVTKAGRQWLGTDLAPRLQGAQAVVNRAPTRAQADLVLVDSPNGPYFSANHLGGMGAIWRVGGAVGEAEKGIVAEMVAATIAKLASPPPAGRSKIGVIALQHGPQSGGWAAVTVQEWLDRLGRSTERQTQVVPLTTTKALQDAVGDNTFLAILNPYGEWSPVLSNTDMPATVEAVRNYARAGGNWFEVGGHPFFYALRPTRYLSYSTPYPDAFADFFHFDTGAGTAAIYGVQPRPWAPWSGAKDKHAIFVPGNLDCGGDEQGGYCDRAFATYVAAGQSWQTPIVSLRVGQDAPQSLKTYCQANGITRRLEDKMSAATLQKFKNAVLVYYAGNAQEKLAHLGQLPVPSLIHFADYLKGGFDKQYPDHLPPNPQFGTPQELRAFIDRSHALGHLVMPYTNPTWWCDHPRGPTFEQAGEAPLLRDLDGKLSYEKYSANDGYTVTHWHPAVQAANRKTVRQFSQEYPVDVLFQDQNGARSWHYDTNPASPNPYAYIEGLLSQVGEDAAQKPLSTEAGWDHVVNDEAQLCGMTFELVPTEGAPQWRRLMQEQYPPNTWEIFPLAEYIAHDKVSMLHHDLGQFVTNREVLSWTLGLGFGISYRTSAGALDGDANREWLRWLDRIQKSVCSRYIGQPLTAFRHERGPVPTTADGGVLRATYGPIHIIANLGPQARTEDSYALPAYGFVARAPGLMAANMQYGRNPQDNNVEGISFVSEAGMGQTDLWIYAAPEQEVTVPLPPALQKKSGPRAIPLQFDAIAVQGTAKNAVLSFRLPARSITKRVAPAPALAGKTPLNWPGAKPAIGILDLGHGLDPNWTRTTPAQWMQAFQQSHLATALGVPVKSISTVAELVAALKVGPTTYFCIVNPYGEQIPAVAPGAGRAMLELVRHYVENGGCWWETGGYSFSQATSLAGDNWQGESLGPGGSGYFGLPVGGGAVDAPAEPLHATPTGQQWLGETLSAQVAQTSSATNRGLTRGNDDPGHVTLVAGQQEDFIGGYRLNGWGWLWRIGGFYPNPAVALPVTVAATEYLYTHPTLPVQAGGTKYLWHAVVRTKSP